MFDSRMRILLFLFAIPVTSLTASPPSGIFGGQDNGLPWAAFFDSSGNVYPVDSALLPNTGAIHSVAINGLGVAALGGDSSYLGLTSSPSAVNVVPISSGHTLLSVAINDSSALAIAGTNAPSGMYGAVIAPDQTETILVNNSNYGGNGSDAAINNLGYAVVGGETFAHNAYGVLVQPNGTQIVFQNAYVGYESTVSMNSSGESLVGGGDGNSQPAFAFFVSPNGVRTPISIPSHIQNDVNSVAINDSGNGLLGGNVGGPYAALVSSSNVVTPLTVPVVIDTVAINNNGEGLIGGNGYAAFVSPGGVVTSLSIPAANITSVAIDESGQGVIGGTLGSAAYAARVYPSGEVVSFNGLPASGTILQLALGPYMPQPPSPSQLPTGGVSGNNKRFANYINENAPQDVIYFEAAMSNGTLEQDLKNAAPTRNLIPLLTSDNNLFSISQGISAHLRNQRKYVSNKSFAGFFKKEVIDNLSEGFIASNCSQLPIQSQFLCPLIPNKDCPSNIWLEGIGYLAFQDSQRQTVGFSPRVAGGILGFDRYLNSYLQLGTGAAYVYSTSS